MMRKGRQKVLTRGAATVCKPCPAGRAGGAFFWRACSTDLGPPQLQTPQPVINPHPIKSCDRRFRPPIFPEMSSTAYRPAYGRQPRRDTEVRTGLSAKPAKEQVLLRERTGFARR